jgi:2,4-dienoyl-CoA reductase-like NADH-dependent reductase (Old Yellow Enzyme family)
LANFYPFSLTFAVNFAHFWPKFAGVKLNSSDFQKGGFTHEEAVEVAGLLDKAGIDLLEISGGNYEKPSLLTGDVGKDSLSSTFVREAYFLKYAQVSVAFAHHRS